MGHHFERPLDLFILLEQHATAYQSELVAKIEDLKDLFG